jgi:glycosyltransferase involved in cell wall biosynthesis
MRIRFVHQYFHPDLSSVSQVLSQIAFHLGEKGEEVSVLCSRNNYNGAGDETPPGRETVRGVEIRRCWGPSRGRRSVLDRILDMASFCLLATLRLLVSPRVDTVVFLTNPPFYSLLGPILRKARGERFVHILMDVYPDVVVQGGMLREDSVVVRVLRRIARFTLENADCVIVLGDDMKDVAIRTGAAPDRVAVIRNWADPEKIYPVPPNKNRLRREWGLDGKFVVEYSGNFGVSHCFDDLLAVAEELSNDEEIRFLFIGDGARHREVEERVSTKGLRNVTLLPYQRASDLAQSLSVGDVHYISLRPGFEGVVVPSKAYGIMAAGRPIVYQGDIKGEIAQMVLREGIGVVVEPGDREKLRDEIISLYRDEATRIRTGEAARSVLVEKYSAAIGLAQYSNLLARL